MTTTHAPQLLYQIQQSIREAKRHHPGFKVIVEMAVDTQLDIAGQLRVNDVQQLYGCEVDLKPDWTWGVAVRVVDEEDDGNAG